MIKVGDDSLTIDKCRRSGGSDVVVPTVTFYKVGDLTTGLKIFVDRGGRDIKVSNTINVNFRTLKDLFVYNGMINREVGILSETLVICIRLVNRVEGNNDLSKKLYKVIVDILLRS
jgi:hypothetical protein